MSEEEVCANCEKLDIEHDDFGHCPGINMKRFVPKGEGGEDAT